MTPAPHDYEPPDEDFNPDPGELCSNCVRDMVDPRSFFGWCRRCTAQVVATHKTERQRRWRLGEIDFAKDQLPKLENVIRAGMRTFITVGLSLKAIRDRRLYRDAGFRNFETYCRERWGFGMSYANKQISAAIFTNALASEEMGTPVPTLTEWHIRELRRLPVDDAREVWSELVATYPKNLITGDTVRAEVDRRLNNGHGQVMTREPTIMEVLCTACGAWHPIVETRTT